VQKSQFLAGVEESICGGGTALVMVLASAGTRLKTEEEEEPEMDKLRRQFQARERASSKVGMSAADVCAFLDRYAETNSAHI
jgi:hypothetical protein